MSCIFICIFFIFCCQSFSDLYPQSKWKLVVWGLAGVTTGLTAYHRYRAGKHYYSDVILGGIFEGIMGILVPQMYKSNRGGSVSLRKDQLSLLIHI